MHPMALGASNHNPDYGPASTRVAPATPPAAPAAGRARRWPRACAAGAGHRHDGLGAPPGSLLRRGRLQAQPRPAGAGRRGAAQPWLDHVGLLARRVEDIVAALRIVAPRLDEPGPSGRRPLAPGGRARRPGPGRQRRGAAGLRCRPSPPGRPARCGVAGRDAAGLRPRRHPARRPAAVRGRTAPDAGRSGAAPARRPAGRSAVDDEVHRTQVRDRPGRGGGPHRTHRRTADDPVPDGFDALLLPTAPQTAFAMDQPAPANQADFTALANTNGAPAISLPLPVPDGSLPVGPAADRAPRTRSGPAATVAADRTRFCPRTESRAALAASAHANTDLPPDTPRRIRPCPTPCYAACRATR
jgi:hypothetical protein